MELNKNMMQKTVLALVLLAVAALSAFVVSERVSAPEYHKASMEALEDIHPAGWRSPSGSPLGVFFAR